MANSSNLKEKEQKWLLSHPLFSPFNEEQRTRLFALLTKKTYAQEETIFSLSNEEPLKDLYIVARGEVEIWRETPFGKQPYAILKSGDFFGELHMIDEQGPVGEIQAYSDVIILTLDSEKLKQIFDEDNRIACHFHRQYWRSITEKIQQGNTHMKKFFAAGAPVDPSKPPEAKARARPAWFAPPEGVATSGSSSTMVGVPSIPVTMEDKKEALKRVGLEDKEIDRLFQFGEEMAYPADEAIFREGDFGDTLYFILSGRVRISKQIPGIGEEALAIVDSGSFFGEMALVSENATRSADCYAHEGPVLLLAFQEHILNAQEGLAASDLLFLQILCKILVYRLRETYAKLVNWRMMAGGFF